MKDVKDSPDAGIVIVLEANEELLFDICYRLYSGEFDPGKGITRKFLEKLTVVEMGAVTCLVSKFHQKVEAELARRIERLESKSADPVQSQGS